MSDAKLWGYVLHIPCMTGRALVVDMCADTFTVSSFLEAIEDQTISVSESNSVSIANQSDRKPENEHDREGQQKDGDSRTSKDDDLMEGGL